VTEYDYVVVGGGTAGCVLAARLTQQAGLRVLLLEAGSAERTPAMTVPDAWPQLLGTAADWAGVTTSQAEAGPVAYPRGRTLGGSGAINAMAHLRGHRAVDDGWAAAGAVGWGFADLLPYFRRSEHAGGRDPALRGTSGPVRIRRTVGSYYHPVGTCRVGSDPDAVVDTDLRVRGITGLRIAGASVIPVISNAPTSATVLAIAEKAAAMISGR
jgi:choline dehydrogenase-like flavoprotein